MDELDARPGAAEIAGRLLWPAAGGKHNGVGGPGTGREFLHQLVGRPSAERQEAFGYSFFFIGGAITLGLIGPAMVARAKEPLMPAVQESKRSPLDTLMEPLRDRNFSQLLRFLWVWVWRPTSPYHSSSCIC